MIRKFYLKNKKGETYELTNYKTFLNAPNNLGFKQDVDIVRLGNDCIVGNNSFEHMSIGGDVLFMNDTNANIYQQYSAFAKFVLSTPIYLFYDTPNNSEPYFCEVCCTKMDKTEIAQDGIMHAPVELKALSFWQNSTINEKVVTTGYLTGKKYELIRKEKDGYFYGTDKLKQIIIDNDGTIESGVEIEIKGTIENPQISFYNEEGEQYGVSKFLGSFDYVLVNSSDRNENIILKKGASVLANPISYQDLSVGNGSLYTTFVKLRRGVNILSIGYTNKFDGAVAIRWRNTYATI